MTKENADQQAFPGNPPDDELVSAREIIGDDDREHVDSEQPNPWHAVALLEITRRDGSPSMGTGWYAAPRLIITAGHCVYERHDPDPAACGWVKSITVTPAVNGDHVPYQSFNVTDVRTTEGWVNSGDLRTDYGALLLPEAAAPHPEPYKVQISDNQTLFSSEARIAGYPTDKPIGTLWEARSPIKSADDFEIFYEIDTKAGESGAPVLQPSDNSMVVTGIHHWGASPNDPLNRGIRLTDDVYQNLKRWKQESEASGLA